MPKKASCAKSNEIILPVVDASADNLLNQTRKRILLAYMPIIILTRIEEIGFTSPTDTITTIKSNYNIKLSSGTV